MGTRAPVTYTINGQKIEFDGDSYRTLKDNGEFDEALERATEWLSLYAQKTIFVRVPDEGGFEIGF